MLMSKLFLSHPLVIASLYAREILEAFIVAPSYAGSISKVELFLVWALHLARKRILEPNNILNPGNFLDL